MQWWQGATAPCHSFQRRYCAQFDPRGNPERGTRLGGFLLGESPRQLGVPGLKESPQGRARTTRDIFDQNTLATLLSGRQMSVAANGAKSPNPLPNPLTRAAKCASLGPLLTHGAVRDQTVTPDQTLALAIIRRLNTGEFSDWFVPSEVMAFCQVESGFRAKAYRYEPALGEGSYGLMQVLAGTARDVAGVTNPESMYDPETGLRVGMQVAKRYWELLSASLHRDPTLAEWSASYNEGVHGALRDASDGHIDVAYARVWEAARLHWAQALADDPPAPTITPSSQLIRDIQTELKNAGFDPGPLDGIWGPHSQSALDKAASYGR